MASKNIGSLFKESPLSKVKGLEKVIYLIANFTIKANASAVKVFYGSAGPSKGPIDKALKVGLIRVLEQLSTVDFCNILSYLAGKLGGGGFNPNNPPEGGGVAAQLWKIQNEAFKLQLAIDRNLAEVTDFLGPDSTLRLTDLIILLSDTIRTRVNTSVDEFIAELKSQSQNSDRASEIASLISRVEYFKLGLSELTSVLDTFGANVTIGNAQKAINLINKVRTTLVLIQGLNNPAAALALANQLTGGAIQQQIARLSSLIPVDKLIPLLKKCTSTANKINSVGQKILAQIKTIQFIVKIALIIIKVFDILRLFFILYFKLPNMMTTMDQTNMSSNIVQDKINNKVINMLIMRLEQLNYTIGLIYNFCNFLVSSIDEVSMRLKEIQLNIESCQNIDDSLKEDISNTINNLANTRNSLQEFINSVNNANKVRTNTAGEYTIEIITEEVVDESINLRRRFGIAKNRNNVVVVETTPTFASLDLIIINEVKSKLAALGLIKLDSLGLALEDLDTIKESLSFLGDETVSLSDVSLGKDMDSESIQEDINEFIGNLPGGRRMRIKIRKKLIKNNINLINKVRQADPSSDGTKKLVKQKESEVRKLKIKNLEDEKKGLEIQLKVLLVIPGGQALAIPIQKRIDEIDSEIQKIRKEESFSQGGSSSGRGGSGGSINSGTTTSRGTQ